MVLNDLSPRYPFAEYGIDIPILGSNGRKTVEALLATPGILERREQWLLEKELTEVSRERIERVHESAYVARLFGEACEAEITKTFELIDENGAYHRYDPAAARRPLCDLFDRTRRSAQGTVEAAHLALKTGFCFYLGGGMHHGQYDFGSGFCPINDIVIAARDVLATADITSVWVIDVDAHKGDGTAALTDGDASIVTFSQHMASGWPLDQPETLPDGRPNPSHIPSDVDVPIGEGEEEEYLMKLRIGLDALKAHPVPGLAIVLAGADPYERDELPSASQIKLSAAQMLQRDLLVDAFLRSLQIPALYVMAGNYGPHSWEVYTRFLTHFLSRATSR